MDTLERLQTALDADPLDGQTRLVLADWYDDHGDAGRAGLQRWLAAQSKRPRLWSGDYAWYHEDQVSSRDIDPESDLPGDLFNLLPDRRSPSSAYYSTRRVAEEALLIAWLKWAGHSAG